MARRPGAKSIESRLTVLERGIRTLHANDSAIISASPTVLQALLANEIEAASISVTTLTASRLAGADTVMVLGVVPTFVDHIVTRIEITSVEQLRGKTAGVNRLGSTSDDREGRARHGRRDSFHKD